MSWGEQGNGVPTHLNIQVSGVDLLAGAALHEGGGGGGGWTLHEGRAGHSGAGHCMGEGLGTLGLVTV